MLEKVLADTYILYLKTQNYHWNVKGPEFKSLHDLFQLHYEDMFLAVDLIAERIVGLVGFVDGTFNQFKSVTVMTEGAYSKKAMEMVKELCDDHKKIQNTINAALKTANDAHDTVTEDLLITRLAFHQKAVWMLGAILQ